MGTFKSGTSYLEIGLGISLIAGYGINVWLARFFGPSQYGVYGVVMSLLLWVEIGIISGIPTAVLKFVSADKGHSLDIIKKASVIQILLIAVIFIISFVSAPFTSTLFHYSKLGDYLRIALIDLWFYGFYFVFLYLQSGLHNFGRQAILIALYSVSKFIFVIVFVLISSSITGAFIANIAASIIGLSVSLFFARKIKSTKTEGSYSYKTIINFAMPIAFFGLFINLFLNVDLWVVKIFLGNAEAGFYVSASTVARVPYYLFFALPLTVLPLLSRSLSKGDEVAVKKTISNAVHFLILAAILIIAITIGYGREIIILLFSKTYQASGEVLQVLICGMSLLALFLLFATILNADNRPRISFALTAFCVLLDVSFAILLVKRMGIIGGAWATTFSLAIATAIGWILIKRRFGPFFSFKSGLKILFSGLIVFAASLFIRVSGIYVLGVGFFLSLIYIALLLIFKEISLSDLNLIKYRRQE